jgi:hypothetical protein
VFALLVPLKQQRQRQPAEALGQLAERAKAGFEAVSLQALDRVGMQLASLGELFLVSP